MGSRKTLKLRELKAILASYGIECDTSRGKGGHVLFRAIIQGRPVSYPVPGDREVKQCYVSACRRRFGLTPNDGVTDDDFYGRG